MSKVAAASSDRKTVSTESKTVVSPPLEAFDRMMKLPVIEAAWTQGHDVYSKVKNSNTLVEWALTVTEGAIQRTASIASPLVHKLDGPIHLVDQAIVQGIDRLETTAPIIKEDPQQIYEQTKSIVMETVQPHVDRVCRLKAAGQQKMDTIKSVSMEKSNAALSTPYGSMAINGVHTTSALAEKLLDYCFPPTDGVEEDDAPISAEENPTLHTIQTVGRLSNKISRRVYKAVVRQVDVLRKQDVQDYVSSLIAILRFTHYLKLANHKEIQAANCDDVKETCKATKSSKDRTVVN